MAGTKINSTTVSGLRSRTGTRRTHAAVCFRALLIAIGLATEANGQTRQIEVAWQAPPGCPRQSQIEAEILRLISPRAAETAQMLARARIEIDANGRYRLALRTRQAGNDGERLFDGATCQAVADAAIVTLALSLDPNAAIPMLPAEPAGSKTRQEPPSPEEQAPAVAPDRSPPRVTRVRLANAAVKPETTQIVARAFVGGHAGVLPRLGGELGLGLGVQYTSFVSYVTVAMAPVTQTAASQNSPGLGRVKSRAKLEALPTKRCHYA